MKTFSEKIVVLLLWCRFLVVSNITVRQAWCVAYQTHVLVDEWWGAAVSPSMYTWMPQPFALGCAGWGPVASSVMEVSWRGFKPHLAHKKVPYDVTLCA